MSDTKCGMAETIRGACRSLTLAALLPVVSVAEIVPVNTTLVTPGTYNRLTVDLAYTGTGSGSDSDTTDATGDFPLILDVSFDDNHNAAVNGIAFELNAPGTVFLTDAHWQWPVFFFFTVWVEGRNLRVTGYTPVPYSPVSGGNFATSDHNLILNHGTVTTTTDAPEDAPPPVDLSVSPLVTTTYGQQGTIAISDPVIEKDMLVYDVTLTYPVDFDVDLDADTSLAGSGTLRSTGQFSRELPPDPDQDGDGMPDDWEILHFGNTNETAEGDWDEDGACNADEWYADTQPKNPRSVLEIRSIDGSGDDVVVTWQSVAGRTYALQRCEDIDQPSWGTIKSNMPASGALGTCTGGVFSIEHYYRIRVE